MRKKFDSEWTEAISVLGEKEAAHLHDIITRYQLTYEEPGEFNNPLSKALFSLIRVTIDRRRRASDYARRRRQRMRSHEAITPPATRDINAEKQSSVNTHPAQLRQSHTEACSSSPQQAHTVATPPASPPLSPASDRSASSDSQEPSAPRHLTRAQRRRLKRKNRMH